MSFLLNSSSSFLYTRIMMMTGVRRATGIRTTKILFLIFPLLDLIRFTNSHSAQKHLTALQELCQKTKEDLEKLKKTHQSEFRTPLDAADEGVNIINPVKALMKKYDHNLPHSHPPVHPKVSLREKDHCC